MKAQQSKTAFRLTFKTANHSMVESVWSNYNLNQLPNLVAESDASNKVGKLW